MSLFKILIMNEMAQCKGNTHIIGKMTFHLFQHRIYTVNTIFFMLFHMFLFYEIS